MSFQVSDWDNNDLGDLTHSNLFKQTKVEPNQQTKKSKTKHKANNEVTTKSDISNPKQRVKKKITLEKNEERNLKKKIDLNVEGKQLKNVSGSQEVNTKISYPNILNESQIKVVMNKKRSDKKKLRKLNIKQLQREQKLQNTEKFKQKKINKSQETENEVENATEVDEKRNKKKKKKLQKNKLVNVLPDESVIEAPLNENKLENKLKKRNAPQNIQEPPQKDRKKIKKELKRLQNQNLKDIPNEESSRDVKTKKFSKENEKISQESKKKLQKQTLEKNHIENKQNEINVEAIGDASQIKENKYKLKKKLKRLQNTHLKNIQNDQIIGETNGLKDYEQSKQQNIKTQDNKGPKNNQNKNVMNITKLNEEFGRTTIQPINPLRERMLKKLKAARFRFINEQMYTNESKEAQKLFQEDPEAFAAYHDGYRQQISKWPLNPLDTIINAVKKMPSNYVIADFGCGDARLAKSVPHKVYSFDLVSIDPSVVACDMAHCPIKKNTVDVVVFCLSLMGTNLKDYLFEANRVLKVGGILKIAEVESRFEGVEQFLEGLVRFGFTNTWKDLSHNLFYFLNFKKDRDIIKKNKLPTISLNPCLYKKR